MRNPGFRSVYTLVGEAIDRGRDAFRRPRRRKPVKRAGVFVVATLTGLAPGCGRQGEEAPEAKLAVGQTVEVTLGEGDTARFRLEVEDNRYVEIGLDSDRIDADLFVSGPGGRRILTLASTHDRWGEERGSLITEEAGPHRLEIAQAASANEEGTVRLRIRDLRPVEERDLERVQADGRLNEGLALREQEGRDELERALAIFEESRSSILAAENAPWRARAHYLVGITHRALDDYDKALAALGEARSIWSGSGDGDGDGDGEGDPGWLGETLYEMGNCHAFAGRFPQALARYDEALPLLRDSGAREREASVLNNRGFVFKRLGDMQGALDSYSAALAVFRDLGLREEEATALSNAGSAYQALGDPERALRHFEAGLPTWRELGERKSEAIALNNIGWSHRNLERYEQAVTYFDQAVEIARELGSDRHEGIYLGNRGRALLDLGRAGEALESCRAGLAASDRANDARGRLLRSLCIGLAQLELGDLEAAGATLEETRGRAQKMGEKRALAETLVALAELRRETGDLLAAGELVDSALEIVEAVRTDVDIGSMRSSYLAFHRRFYDLKIDLLMSQGRERRAAAFAATALRVSERARARGLLEVLAEATAGLRGEVDPALLEAERRVRAQINALVLADEPSDAELRRLLHRADEIEGRIRRANPRYAEFAYPRPPTLEEIQGRLLDDRTLLLQYSLGKRRSYLWAVTSDDFRWYELAPRSVITARARRVHELLADDDGAARSAGAAPGEALWTEALELSRLVLGPAASELDREVLLVVTEGALDYVPFSFLPNPTSSDAPRPLIVDHEVVRAPSLSVLAAQRSAAAPAAPAELPKRTMLVLADPVFGRGDPRFPHPRAGATEARSQADIESPSALPVTRGPGLGLARLRHSGAEAAAIGGLLPESDRRILLGLDASRRALEEEAAAYRVLHFATHGILDSNRPRLSGLVLSLVDERGRRADGFLRLHDIYGLQLDSDLVVLSACSTALGKQMRGEGLIGLTRGFLHSGARRVVASLWSVEDEATAELMRRFYQGLFHRGETPAAALRGAQLALFEGAGDARWTAPYYWAAFTLFGDWTGDLSAQEDKQMASSDQTQVVPGERT